MNQECDRVHNIASSAMDASWTQQIPVGVNTALIIVEGLSMYLAADDVRQIFSIIRQRFSHATVFMEILNPVFIKRNVEKSISQSGAVFTWGAKSGEELMNLVNAFCWQGDRSLVEGMIWILCLPIVISFAMTSESRNRMTRTHRGMAMTNRMTLSRRHVPSGLQDKSG